MLPNRKLNQINMVAKLRYIYFIYFLLGIQLLSRKCECTNSSTNSTEAIASIPSAAPVQIETVSVATTTAATPSSLKEARKLSDDAIESITSDSNSLSVGPSELLTDEQITNHDFRYFNEPTTTNGYQPASFTNHRQHHTPVRVVAVHMAKPMNKTHFSAPLLTTPYSASTNNYVPSGNRLRIVHITNSPPWTSSPSSPSSALSSLSPQPQASSHELTHLPYLENQYIASFRNIKSSVMNIIYKVQDFMSYVMSLFTMEETPLVEGRHKKHKLKKKLKLKKFKIKKKFKKFLIPLLLAYKLKFFALIPLIIGGLILLVGSTGMAGFFFALFTAVISLRNSKH